MLERTIISFLVVQQKLFSIWNVFSVWTTNTNDWESVTPGPAPSTYCANRTSTYLLEVPNKCFLATYFTWASSSSSAATANLLGRAEEKVPFFLTDAAGSQQHINHTSQRKLKVGSIAPNFTSLFGFEILKMGWANGTPRSTFDHLPALPLHLFWYWPVVVRPGGRICFKQIFCFRLWLPTVWHITCTADAHCESIFLHPSGKVFWSSWYEMCKLELWGPVAPSSR